MQSLPTAIAYMIPGSTGLVCACTEVRRYAASDGVSPGIVYADVRFPAAGWISHEVSGLEVAVHTRPAHVRHEVDYESAALISERENFIIRRPGVKGTSRWDGPMTSQVLSYSAPTIERIAGLPITKISFVSEGADMHVRRSTYQILQALSCVYSEDHSPDRLLIDSLCLAVLRSVISEASSVRSSATSLSPPETKRACAYIKDNLTSNITVADLARAVGFSEGYLIRAFRQAMGLTPYQYIMRERVAAAEALMLAGDLPISNIAEMVGFPSGSAMSRAFRKYRGHSPTGK